MGLRRGFRRGGDRGGFTSTGRAGQGETAPCRAYDAAAGGTWQGACATAASSGASHDARSAAATSCGCEA